MFTKNARWIFVLLLTLTACSGNGATPTSLFPSPLPVTRTFTPAPSDTPLVFAATDTPTPAPPTAFATLTPQPPCINDSFFNADVTVPDGAQFLPTQTLVKKWSVQNTGTCDWGPDYRLVLVSGDAMGTTGEAALYPAKGGVPAVLEVAMTAPLTPGEYTGRWQARDPQGNLFGAVVFIKIEVIPLPTP